MHVAQVVAGINRTVAWTNKSVLANYSYVSANSINKST